MTAGPFAGRDDTAPAYSGMAVEGIDLAAIKVALNLEKRRRCRDRSARRSPSGGGPVG